MEELELFPKEADAGVEGVALGFEPTEVLQRARGPKGQRWRYEERGRRRGRLPESLR